MNSRIKLLFTGDVLIDDNTPIALSEDFMNILQHYEIK